MIKTRARYELRKYIEVKLKELLDAKKQGTEYEEGYIKGQIDVINEIVRICETRKRY